MKEFLPQLIFSLSRERLHRHALVCLLFTWLFFSVAAPLAGAAELKAGVAVVEITPPVGYRMSGYFYERLSTDIHDPLLAKAIVFQQGRERAAVVVCDLSGISLDLSTRARQQASHKTGIPVSNILIAATHSHTGPLYFGALRWHFHQAAVDSQGEDFYERTDYPSILVERLVDAIAKANRSVQPVHLEVGQAQKKDLSFNRRFHMKNGSVAFNPGKLNTNIIRAAGPIDPELGVLLVLDQTRKRALASFMSFALHADTVGGTQYSADFPFYLERSLRKILGQDLTSIFANGTCGDINHLDVSDARPQKGPDEAERIGAALAQSVAEALPALKPINKPALAVRSTKISAPLQQFTPQQISQAQEKMALVGTKHLAFLGQVEVYKIMDLQLRGGEAVSLEVQVFRLGSDTAIVGLPGEIFVELGLAIKEASPFKNTFVIELCNDAIGYVPTRKAFGEGSYEIVNSRVQPGGGEMLVETAIKLLKDLK